MPLNFINLDISWGMGAMLKKDIGQDFFLNHHFVSFQQNVLHHVLLFAASCKTNVPEMKIQWADNRLIKQ